MLRSFAVLAVAGLLALPASASAEPPDREVLPSGAVTATACGFDVLIEPVKDKFTLMTFPEGLPVVQFLTGHSIARLSSANASIMLNVSGPSFTTVNHDGSIQFSGAGPLGDLRSSVHKSASARLRDRPTLVRNRRADDRSHRTNRGPLRLARINA